jgi:hypothetical protein
MVKEMKDSKNDEMREEYDFSGGVRGKHYKAYREGHIVRIHKEDGSISVHYFSQEDGAIMLDPDVQKYYPDSESVNRALRKSLEKAREANNEESTNSQIVARLPWREQPIRGIKYPEGYVGSAGSPVFEP